MVLPTGQISMSQVNTELGYSSSAQISLNDSAVRRLAANASPTSPFLSGAISKNDLRGKNVRINATGGNKFQDGNYMIHIFTSPGTFVINWTFNSACTFEYVVVGGGGGGSGVDNPGGGGGAGGFRTGFFTKVVENVILLDVFVGAGGVGAPGMTSGTSSYITDSFSDFIFPSVNIYASGGARGSASAPGIPGGSGGGGGAPSGVGGSGNIGGYIPSEGNPGGFANSGEGASCGGGGGATQSGFPASSISDESCGGDGAVVPWLIGQGIGSPFGYFSGGGGGARKNPPSVPNPLFGLGGLGGGGNGSSVNYTASPGVVNTGGGGGGGGYPGRGNGRAGGSGIVVVRYPYI